MPRDNSAICDECGTVIRRKNDLKRHKLSHAPNRESLKHPCAVEGCGKAFLQYSNLKVHLNTHTGRRPYHCPDCISRFNDPSACILHRKRKHGYVPKPRAKFQGVAPMSRINEELTKESLCTVSSSTPADDSDADERNGSEKVDELAEDGSSAPDTDVDDETHRPTVKFEGAAPMKNKEEHTKESLCAISSPGEDSDPDEYEDEDDDSEALDGLAEDGSSTPDMNVDSQAVSDDGRRHSTEKFRVVAPMSKNEEEHMRETLCTALPSSSGKDSDTDEHDEIDALGGSSTPGMDRRRRDEPSDSGLPAEDSHDCNQGQLASATSRSEIDDESN